MDFFADGGFQQLFCDLQEDHHNVQEDIVIWETPFQVDFDDFEKQQTALAASAILSPLSNSSCSSSSSISATDCYVFFGAEKLCFSPENSSQQFIQEDHNFESHHITDLNEKHLQESLDYLLNSSSCLTLDATLNSSYELEQYERINFISKDLSEWEDKFLDNYIEIPELVNILPDKTALCTENCEHFLQESSEQLKINFEAHISEDNCKENDKTYPCTYGDCHKIYAKPAHLKAHLRRHMGEKPYICNWPQCTWRFSRSDELARHRRSHSGVKPYKCDYCAKCFARSDHLTKHRKVHERRLLAANRAGKVLDGVLPASVLTVRPGRKKKNQF